MKRGGEVRKKDGERSWEEQDKQAPRYASRFRRLHERNSHVCALSTREPAAAPPVLVDRLRRRLNCLAFDAIGHCIKSPLRSGLD